MARNIDQSPAERILDEELIFSMELDSVKRNDENRPTKDNEWYARQLSMHNENTRRQLRDALLERLPEKKIDSSWAASVGESKYHEGYNLALSEVEDIVRSFFGGSDD